jgi:hypothetical protein
MQLWGWYLERKSMRGAHFSPLYNPKSKIQNPKMEWEFLNSFIGLEGLRSPIQAALAKA